MRSRHRSTDPKKKCVSRLCRSHRHCLETWVSSGHRAVLWASHYEVGLHACNR